MSAVTVRVLNQHLAAVRRQLAGAGLDGSTSNLAQAVDSYADQLSKASRLVRVGHLAALTATTLVPHLTAEITYRAGQLGYLIRPYDQLADARRWRWQPRQPCGLGGLAPAARERLLEAAGRLAARVPICPEHQLLGPAGDVIALPVLTCPACARWMADQR